MASLLDKVNAQETAKKPKTSEKKKAVSQIALSGNVKNKQISAKVNGELYAAFTRINRAQGITNNSALNMIMSKYVRDNKILLEE